jgi:hypothetical protein
MAHLSEDERKKQKVFCRSPRIPFLILDIPFANADHDPPCFFAPCSTCQIPYIVGFTLYTTVLVILYELFDVPLVMPQYLVPVS